MSYDEPNSEPNVQLYGAIKIVQDFPPNIDRIRAVLTPEASAVFTYGNTIYAPQGLDLQDKPLIAHEKVHMRQQGQAVAHWWDRYLAEPNFRLWQEVAAYHRQYMVAKRRLHPKIRPTYLRVLAGFLASPMYDGLVSIEKATRLIDRGHV